MLPAGEKSLHPLWAWLRDLEALTKEGPELRMGGSLEGSHEVASGALFKRKAVFLLGAGRTCLETGARAWCSKLRAASLPGPLRRRCGLLRCGPPEQLLASFSARPWSASFSQSFQSCSPSSGSLRGSRSAAASAGVSPGPVFSPPSLSCPAAWLLPG